VVETQRVVRVISLIRKRPVALDPRRRQSMADYNVHSNIQSISINPNAMNIPICIYKSMTPKQ